MCSRDYLSRIVDKGGGSVVFWRTCFHLADVDRNILALSALQCQLSRVERIRRLLLYIQCRISRKRLVLVVTHIWWPMD